MLFSVFLLVIGFIALGFGADWLVRGSSGLALMWRISPAVVGLTVVAFGTSAPELAVSVNSALNGKTDMAIGNIVGSNMFNLAGILGICAVVRTLPVEDRTVKVDWWICLAATLLMVAFLMDGTVTTVEGLVLLGGFALFTLWMIEEARRIRRRAKLEDAAARATSDAGAAGELEAPQRSVIFRPWVQFPVAIIAGIALLVLGSDWLVGGASEIARFLGISDRVIGLTVLAAGTSLPELATSFVAVRKGRTDLAVGNVIGSNISNILLILGATATVATIPVKEDTLRWDLPWMVGFTIVLLPMMWFGRRIGRREGALLLGAFFAYLLSILI